MAKKEDAKNPPKGKEEPKKEDAGYSIERLFAAAKLLNEVTYPIEGEEKEVDLLKVKLVVDKKTKEEDLKLAFIDAINNTPETLDPFIPEEAGEVYNLLRAEQEATKAAAKAKDKAGATKEGAKKDKKKGDAGARTGEKKKGPPPRAKNAYGHIPGSVAAAIDDAVEKGGTMETIAKAAGCDVNRVKGHLNHLKKDKGLVIEDNGKGVLKIKK
jgi:hypothetical protein